MDEYAKLPEYLVDELNAYAQSGHVTSGFLAAVLANDLMRACQRADLTNLPLLPLIARYVYNRMPSTCHGSYAAVDAWIEGGGADELCGKGAWAPKAVQR